MCEDGVRWGSPAHRSLLQRSICLGFEVCYLYPHWVLRAKGNCVQLMMRWQEVPNMGSICMSDEDQNSPSCVEMFLSYHFQPNEQKFSKALSSGLMLFPLGLMPKPVMFAQPSRLWKVWSADGELLKTNLPWASSLFTFSSLLSLSF